MLTSTYAKPVQLFRHIALLLETSGETLRPLGVSDCPTLPALSLSPKSPSEKGPAAKRLPFSRLGARVPEHDDLATSTDVREEDLVAVHKDCINSTTGKTDAKSLYDVT